MTQYRLGYELERRIRKRLEDDGYFTLRSGGSKTVVDIAAFKGGLRLGQVLFVQVKRDGKLPTDEWNELYETALHVGAVPVLATTPKRGRLAFHRLTGRRVLRSRTYPSEPFLTDEVAPE